MAPHCRKGRESNYKKTACELHFLNPARGLGGNYRSEDRFPGHCVYCIGRNYFANADEASKCEHHSPYFFQKPADGLVPSGDEFPFPSV